MKRVENCIVENCIPTPASCITWNAGSVEWLGVCDGDPITLLFWEIINKLKEVAGEDLSSFDIDSLADICNQKAPNEVTILSILNLVKSNQICLKDFIDTLSEQIASITSSSAVNVSLKCYAEFDNLGNPLNITRDQLDQLVINILCDHKTRIETLEGKVITMQNQIDSIDTTATVEELSFDTCLDPGVDKPTSTNVINLATAHCDLETATGDDSDIATALGKTPGDLNPEFGAITGWNMTPGNWAENYGNLLLEVENLRQRVIFMEENCCAASCKDVELGFTAVYNEDASGIILRFTAGAGTDIPAGFLDIGSTIVITDVDGNTETYTTADPNLIANNAEIEITITGLNVTSALTVSIEANISNGTLTCNKCLSKTVNRAACDFCEICVSGDDNSTVVIVYEYATPVVT